MLFDLLDILALLSLIWLVYEAVYGTDRDVALALSVSIAILVYSIL